jgi:thiol-disulfide isomerase/thioredoxin
LEVSVSERRLCAFLLLAFLGPQPALAAGATADEVWVAKEERAAAPKLELRDLEGKKRQLAGLKGKLVVLNFWATWCGPCRVEMPAFAKVHAEYRERGVEFVGAANETRASRGKVADFARKLGIGFPIWLEASLDHMEAFNVGPELPATVFVDTQGRVAARIQGAVDESQLRSLIERLLAETAREASINRRPVRLPVPGDSEDEVRVP